MEHGSGNNLLARLAPPAPAGVLSSRGAVKGLAKLADPLVRLADLVVGEKMAMRVEVEFSGEACGGGESHFLRGFWV